MSELSELIEINRNIERQNDEIIRLLGFRVIAADFVSKILVIRSCQIYFYIFKILEILVDGFGNREVQILFF